MQGIVFVLLVVRVFYLCLLCKDFVLGVVKVCFNRVQDLVILASYG